MGEYDFIEIFPPGELLKQELAERKWSQVEFAEIIGKDTKFVNEIINGKRSITPETAIIFSTAFNSNPELWMKLESQYQLSKVNIKTDNISRKAKLYEKFPVRELIKRGWIKASKEIDNLEKECLKFFNISSLEENPTFSHSAKKTNDQETTSVQLSWLFRAKEIAKTILVKKYSEDTLRNSLDILHTFMLAPEEARHVPKLLSECGVCLVFVEPLPGSKIDGACFWLANNKPVIAMSLRHDRIDNFWFVLRHEIEHVLCGHGKDFYCIDQDIDGETLDIPEHEEIANLAASNFCVDIKQLNDFIARVSPFFSEKKVCSFSNRIGVHPGIVIGQLQRRLKKYDFLKKHQVKIRSIVLSSSHFDGWGMEYPI